MTRIAKILEETRAEGRSAIIPFLTGGYPTLEDTVPLVLAAEAAGADLLEIGLPFSDPLADGPAIQLSSQRAIENGATLPWILDQVRKVRETSELPLILMGYLNPMLRYGLDAFVADAVEAGVDGLIVPDLLPEESKDVVAASRQHGLSNVFLIAPTTSVERIRKIDALSTEMSYAVALTGVTGARGDLPLDIEEYLERVRANAEKPFVVGFGISAPEHVRRLKGKTDGCVIGSAIVKLLAGTSGDEATQKLREYLKSLRAS